MVRHHVKKKKNDSKSSAQRKKEEEKQLEEELQNLDRFAGSSDEEDANEENDNSVDEFSEDEDIPAENGGDASDSSGQSGSESEDGSAADEDDDYDDVYQEDMKDPHKHMKVNKNEKESDSGDEEDDSEDDYADAIDKQSDDYDDDELISSSFTSSQGANKGAGMANAMARILGGQLTMQPEKTSESASKKGTKPVILSKTTTPLQRLQQKMKTEEQALRQKRHNRRAENLSAMRLPLAPSAGMSAEKLWKETKKSNRKRNIEDDNDAAAIANEIEGERTHRRIATRGVVALFNAISKHRAAVAAEAAAKEQEKQNAREEGRSARKKGEESGVSSQTKHGFLDMIKKSVKKDESGADGTRKQGGSTPQNGENNKKESAVGWSALKDDYMMNSKLKDWDKMSDDDDDEPSKFDAASFSDGEQELHKSSSRKRLKV